MRKLDARIVTLAAMKPTELKAEWRTIHGEEPPRISSNLLARALAHDIQCEGQPGLAQRARQRLTGAGVARTAPTPALLAPGTQLVREWGGGSHHVLIEEKGRCSYKGKSFTSLSALSRHITGAHWSGPRFFGVGK